MPAPYALAKYVATPMKKRMLRNGKWDAVIHTGRVSGRVHETPLVAFPVAGGFVVFVIYGSEKTDWVKNVLRAGRARIRRTTGEEVEVTDPRILGPAEAWALLPDDTPPPSAWAKVDEYLLLTVT